MATDAADRQHVERRLSAIFAADVTGYSRLMGEDEEGTLERLKAHRRELIDPKITEHHGRIVKTTGDGVLVEFASVVDAVRCAVEIQRVMGERNAGVPQDKQIEFRIGINLGDIIVDDKDIFGDGVNVAARLEQICEPGGVLISGTAYDHLQGKLNLPLDFRGEQQVKNIARPVRSYSVRLDGAPRDWRLDARRLSRWRVPVAAALVLLGVGLFTLLRPSEPKVETASVQRMALPLPDKPSIAVLPFDNLSSDPQQGYFADGITDDLITDLSKLSGMFVIARNSSSTYKGKPTKVQQVAEDLGVRYVLEGSVQREGDQVRINAQLIDAIGGQHLWANRYDGTMKDVFALQDKVIGQIVEALAVKLTSNEPPSAAQAETTKPEAYDALLQGSDHFRNYRQDETLKAITLFEKAIRLDPDYSRAYAAMAAANFRIVQSYWEAATGAEFEHANERMRRYLAKAMQNPTSLAYAVSADVLTQEGRFEEASTAINQAIALAPNDAEIYVSSARILNATGHAAEAEAKIRKALRLDPRFSPGSLRVLAISLFHQERYQEAFDTLQRVVSQQSDVTEDYATLVSCLGHLGRTEGVKTLIDKYNATAVPNGFDPLTVQEMGWWWYGDTFSYDDTYRARLQEGLRKARVPEGAGTDLQLGDYKRLIVKSEGLFQVMGATEIDATTAKALHDRGKVTFVDVRAAGDFVQGHIPGAKNLSLARMLSKENLAQVAGKNDDVVFYCFGKYCPYSAYGAAKALLWGYTHAYRFAGGYPAWKDAGYPVEVSTSQGQ